MNVFLDLRNQDQMENLNMQNDQKLKQILSEISEGNLTTACSLTLIPLSIISTYSGTVDQLLDLVEDPQQDSCLTISLVSHSSTPLDGTSHTGVSLTKKEPSFPIQIQTLLQVSDPESLKQFVKKEASLDSYRWQPSALRVPSQPYLQPAEDTEAANILTEQMLTKLNICQA